MAYLPELPDLEAFGAALDRKRDLLGSDLTFYWDTTFTYPDGTPLDPQGQPYDPATVPSSSATASATVRGTVVYRMQLSPTRATDAASDSLGRGEKTRVAAIIGVADGPTIAGATSFEFHDDRFQIHTIKRDEIVTGYERILVYAAAEGEGT